MADQWSNYTPNPEAETAWVIQALLDVLKQRIPDSMQAQQLIEAIQDQQRALEAAHKDWVVDDQAAYNLRMGAVVLAAYRLLRDRMGHDELLALLREAFITPLRDTIRAGTAHMLDHAPDPFEAMVATSKAREANFLGKGFAFERSRDDERAYYADVTRCLWHSFFVANGAPELTPIFCDFDANWIDAIDPARHGFRFGRDTTVGYGGALCPFHFFRLRAQERSKP
jgi:hypothetical protein